MSHVECRKVLSPVTKAPISHVAPKMCPCHMSILRIYLLSLIFILMSLGSMSHVDLKKQPFYHVKIKHNGLYRVLAH